jgi:hypothetical protein
MRVHETTCVTKAEIAFRNKSPILLSIRSKRRSFCSRFVTASADPRTHAPSHQPQARAEQERLQREATAKAEQDGTGEASSESKPRGNGCRTSVTHDQSTCRSSAKRKRSKRPTTAQKILVESWNCLSSPSFYVLIFKVLHRSAGSNTNTGQSVAGISPDTNGITGEFFLY